MRILEYRPIGGRDFHATMECEHCGGTQELKTGYNDAYYHHHVIPAMTCKACGKNQAGEIPSESNDHGMKHVEARLAIRRFPPSKKVLDERRPPAPWILLTEDPEPSPAHPEEVAEEKTKRCAWTYDETNFAWESSCGEKWVLMDGGPNEYEFRFCHRCGKPVEVACEATPEKARQP